ncbi:putative phytosulfokines 6 [Iris pallida]|uniref:Phytosulfokines 6 n=1 Tax=Iris pallida TaxID=29817 RepID=A0AAX6DPX9_IRIPA|nr:putative phytosulfokines 6 [Iris pallida]
MISSQQLTRIDFPLVYCIVGRLKYNYFDNPVSQSVIYIYSFYSSSSTGPVASLRVSFLLESDYCNVGLRLVCLYNIYDI